MIPFIIRNFFQGIPVVFGVMTISFILMYIAPGDPVRSMVGDYYDDVTLENLREELGLNQPIYKQYMTFMMNLIYYFL